MIKFLNDFFANGINMEIPYEGIKSSIFLVVSTGNGSSKALFISFVFKP